MADVQVRLWAAALISATFAACATQPAPPAPKTVGAASETPRKLTSTTTAQPSKSAARVSSVSAAYPPISLCQTTISNAPAADGAGLVQAGPLVGINGVSLVLMPATNSCLSSGYGPRNGKPHRGIDYYTKTGGSARAAGDGVIIERKTRADFGNMIVIDHGKGVFTRYAHLESFAAGLSEGGRVKQGANLGVIGSTGATTVRHLHFEILTGAYVPGAGSFGLSTNNPFALARAR